MPPPTAKSPPMELATDSWFLKAPNAHQQQPMGANGGMFSLTIAPPELGNTFASLEEPESAAEDEPAEQDVDLELEKDVGLEMEKIDKFEKVKCEVGKLVKLVKGR